EQETQIDKVGVINVKEMNKTIIKVFFIINYITAFILAFLAYTEVVKANKLIVTLLFIVIGMLFAIVADKVDEK
uniref:hypothetical protein n=1 Tax=Streptococcus sobrinus TaxID=1310 RepID=UPI0005B3C6BC